MKKETWKPLTYRGRDYGDTYAVSNLGNIKNIRTNHILSPFLVNGRPSCSIYMKETGNKRIRVSIAVAEAFVERTDPKAIYASHKNGNVHDCKAENLEWAPRNCSERTRLLEDIAKRHGVSLQWVSMLDKRGVLEQYIKAGTLGSKKLKEIKPGDLFGDLEIVKRVENNRGYKSYLVRNVISGRETIARGADLISGTFKGALLSKKFTPPGNGGKLVGSYRRYFRNSLEFETWEEFKTWAIKAGYTEETSTVHLKDPSLGYTKDNSYFGARGKTFKWRDKALTVSGWAKELGVSRQHIDALMKKDSLENYISHKLEGASRITPGKSPLQ